MKNYTDGELALALFKSGYAKELHYKELRHILSAFPELQKLDELRQQAGLYQDLLDHPFFDGWADTDMSVRDWMMGRLNAALPDQPDEWERCEFSDIRKGDRVRAEFIDITYEGTAVDVRDYKIAIGHNRNEILLAWKNPDLYRIPAPVVHPDPAVSPVIIVHESDMILSLDAPLKMLWVGRTYRDSEYSLKPQDITEWEPADIVAKVIADE